MGARFDEFYVVRKADVFTAEHFNQRYRDIDDRLVPLESALVSWEYQATIVQDRVLAVSENVISALRDKLVSLTQLEWLTATSGSSVLFITGQNAQILVAEADRELFTPGPFALVSRTGDLDAYAIVRTVAYDRQTGQWATTVVATFGDLSAAHTDWSIGALAGSTLAQIAYLTDGKTARDLTLAAKKLAADAATAAHGDAQATAGDRTATGADRAAVTALAQTATDKAAIATTKAAEAAATAGSIAGGPVASVAGRTGIVTGDQLKTALAMAIADVAGLTAALAGKATPADITAAINALKGGAGAAYDTLIELQNIIINDESVASALATVVNQNTAAAAANAKAFANLEYFGRYF